MSLSFEDYRRHDATALAALIRTKEVSAVEVIDTAIARAQAVNASINAIVEPLYDQARQAALHPGDGPLAGVPWAVKDLGHPIAGGAPDRRQPRLPGLRARSRRRLGPALQGGGG